MTINIDDIKVTIRFLKSKTILAQATVTFFGVIETHGWKILKSKKMHPQFQEELWIQPPSYKVGGGWKSIVFIDDRKLYEQVEERIYDAFHLAQSKKQQEESSQEGEDKEEEINIDDIPF